MNLKYLANTGIGETFRFLTYEVPHKHNNFVVLNTTSAITKSLNTLPRANIISDALFHGMLIQVVKVTAWIMRPIN